LFKFNHESKNKKTMPAFHQHALLYPLLAFLLLLGCKGLQDPMPVLTEPVPYCGLVEDYFLGGGIAGAMGNIHGEWNFLIGPNYTSPDFLASEILAIQVDDHVMQVSPEMHRARNTGIFYGIMQRASLTVTLVDFAPMNQPWVARLVKVENHSGKEARISVSASLRPQDGEARIINGGAIAIHADTSRWNFDNLNKESKNWADRYSLITFDTECQAFIRGDDCVIQIPDLILPAEGSYITALYHYQHYRERGMAQEDYIRFIRSRDAPADLEEAITEWNRWMERGCRYDDKGLEQKAADAIEGSLVMVKMLQDSSGGIIAGLGEYPHSYVRDSHGACRLFNITGHPEEVKKVIQVICRKTSVFGYIPNAWQMGADFFHYKEFNNGAAENPAYFVLMIKYYLESTHDVEYVESIYPFMKGAVDVQLEAMENNGWVIDFNGDETERYTCRVDGETYGILSDWSDDSLSRSWSLPSCVLALASTDFFSDYLSKTGREELAGEYARKVGLLRNSIDSIFWRDDLKIHDWCRRRDGSWPRYRIPNYHLFPAWIGVELNAGRQVTDALAMKPYLRPETGFLPTAPGDVEGFSGHNLAYMLYVMKKLEDPVADQVFHTLVTAPIISCWGTVSEFYGPGGVPNGHLLNPFSSGIMGEALIRYSTGFSDEQ
jgi:hypothetical protein